MSVLVNVSYCAEHVKGANPWDGAVRLDGAMHAEWLEEAVDYYRREIDQEVADSHADWQVLVSCTAFTGILSVSAGRERDAFWRLFQKALVVGDATNPGHQAGAAFTLRMGLELAGKLGYDCLIHTAEDIVPRKGILPEVARLLSDGHDYVGEKWGPAQDELNAQFFGCRVQALVPTWDPGKVGQYGHIERYLAAELEGRRLYTGWAARPYHHTHDYGEWKRLLEASKSG